MQLKSIHYYFAIYIFFSLNQHIVESFCIVIIIKSFKLGLARVAIIELALGCASTYYLSTAVSPPRV
jgi:hypothetical protein